MKIGLPKENKNNEYRVGLTPADVRAFTDARDNVFVENYERRRLIWLRFRLHQSQELRNILFYWFAALFYFLISFG